jgi:hypothetical protein
MGLETGDYIDDLVETNPITATDSVTEGSDHLRLVKKVLLQSFPGVAGAVTLTHTQLNDAALKSEAQTIAGAWTFTGAFTSLGIDDNASAIALTLTGGSNVGIGVAAPDSRLQVTENSAGLVGIIIQNSSATNDSEAALTFITTSGNSPYGQISVIRVGPNDPEMIFRINSGGALFDRLVIDSDGDFDFKAGQIITTGRVDLGPLYSNTSLNQGLTVTDGTIVGIMFSSGLGGLVLGTTSNHPLLFFSNNSSVGSVTTAGNWDFAAAVTAGGDITAFA